jgi:hypothetical protein
MPYKDPKQKAEWERRNRPHRIARRRELRSIEAARQPALVTGAGTPVWPFLIAGGAVAVSNPWLGLGAGGLTLGVAMSRKANWRWWVIGAFVVLLSLFALWREHDSDQNRTSPGSFGDEQPHL